MHFQTTTHSRKDSSLTALPQQLRPGAGLDGLFLGQSEGDVLDLWGEPEQRDRVDDSAYLIYKRLGLEVELRQGRVYRLFFFDRKGARSETPLSIDHVRFGASKRDVIRNFGPPAKRGAGRVLSIRKYLRSWLLYPEGVQFDFGKSGKLEVITIFAPATDTCK